MPQFLQIGIEGCDGRGALVATGWWQWLVTLVVVMGFVIGFSWEVWLPGWWSDSQGDDDDKVDGFRRHCRCDNGSRETRKRGDDLRKGFDPNAKRTTTIRIGIALCCAAWLCFQFNTRLNHAAPRCVILRHAASRRVIQRHAPKVPSFLCTRERRRRFFVVLGTHLFAFFRPKKKTERERER